MKWDIEWDIEFDYEPALQRISDGTCTQIIQPGHKFHTGDLISIHGPPAHPQRPGWAIRTPYWPIIAIDEILITKEGIYSPWPGDFLVTWDSPLMNDLAQRNGIDPPTGEDLKRVLALHHRITITDYGTQNQGTPCQIILWEFA